MDVSVVDLDNFSLGVRGERGSRFIPEACRRSFLASKASVGRTLPDSITLSSLIGEVVKRERARKHSRAPCLRLSVASVHYVAKNKDKLSAETLNRKVIS